jgi:tetratricopeptide (TPR) repeat protein
MFMVRHKPSDSRTPDRRTLRIRTLQRRFDFHLGEAIRAALEGLHDKAATHSRTALSISRELRAGAADPRRHQAELAAALSHHARYGATLAQKIALLTESAGHYAALAKADPAGYEVARIEVLTRIALASDAAGSTKDAITLLREVVRMYHEAPAADLAERDLGLARARFHLGRCLLETGSQADGLAETDAGLALAERAFDRLHVVVRGPGWLATTPRYVQSAAPDWSAAAAASMTAHAAAGRWDKAAVAAYAAVLVSGGLAGLGGDTLREAHQRIRAQADAVWARAELSRRAAADGYCPSASMKRFLERSTSTSAAALSAQLAPSTDLPGSRSL